jgi:flavin reductase (DIM6/NTAB) family NADH-FMN oxidoreductase RutF
MNVGADYMSWKEVDLGKVHRLFYPQVSVVVTVESENHVGGMAAIWCTPLSFTPPLVGLGVAPEHETYKMILKAQKFGVNWLDFSYAEKVGELGEISGKQSQNKLARVGFTTIKGQRTSQPLVAEASAVLECVLRERHPTGRHELMVGEVVRAAAKDWFKDYWDFSNYNPLLYAGTVNTDKKSWVFMSHSGKSVSVPLKHEG